MNHVNCAKDAFNLHGYDYRQRPTMDSLVSHPSATTPTTKQSIQFPQNRENPLQIFDLSLQEQTSKNLNNPLVSRRIPPAVIFLLGSILAFYHSTTRPHHPCDLVDGLDLIRYK